MTTEQSRQFIGEYIAAINSDKSDETIDKYVADPNLKGHIIIFEASMPGFQFIPEDILADGNKVAVRCTLQGVHQVELFGVTSKERKVRIDAIIIYELANHKVVKHWIQAEPVTVMRQIGVLPVPDDYV